MRGKPEKFADHYTQATLFWNSQTPVEQAHIVNAFRFELTRVQTPAVRERMVVGPAERRRPSSPSAVADGLGMRGCRRRCRRCWRRPSRRRSTQSPALSLFARPGDGGIRTRRIAILVADGVDGAPLRDAARAR